MKPRILLATPTYDGSAEAESTASLRYAVTDGSLEYATIPQANSLLPDGFNACWVAALNSRDRFTHFGMLHSDVWPVEENWLSILYRELVNHEADMLGTVIAIKDDSLRTSTAFYPKIAPLDPFDQKRVSHVKIEDLSKLPLTFSASESDYLLANDGLMLCDIRKPWIDTEPYPHFAIKSWIEKVDGRFRRRVLSEDWHFSVQLQRKGAKVCATQAVTCRHRGKMWFTTKKGAES